MDFICVNNVWYMCKSLAEMNVYLSLVSGFGVRVYCNVYIEYPHSVDIQNEWQRKANLIKTNNT